MMYQVLASGGVFDFTTRTVVAPSQSSPQWREYMAWLTKGNTPLPPDTIGQDTLAESKAKRCSEIDAYAAGLRNAAVRGRSAAEMSTWGTKLAEARAYEKTPNATAAPLLNSIATIRGITLASMVAKVMAQSEIFLPIEAAIDGARGLHCDAVEAKSTVQEIIAYNWQTGWPSL